MRNFFDFSFFLSMQGKIWWRMGVGGDKLQQQQPLPPPYYSSSMTPYIHTNAYLPLYI